MSLHLGQGDQYIGRDGQTHQYTNVDWDTKTNISRFVDNGMSKEESAEYYRKLHLENLREMKEDILETAAVEARPYFPDFIMITDNVICWNMEKLENLSWDQLRDIAVILRNRRRIIAEGLGHLLNN